jgi:hypothetical protein
VCDLAPGRFTLLQDNVEDTMLISQTDLFALTQMKDSFDYVGTTFGGVVGQEPYKFEVLTGWVANNLTKRIADKHRAMCL